MRTIRIAFSVLAFSSTILTGCNPSNVSVETRNNPTAATPYANERRAAALEVQMKLAHGYVFSARGTANSIQRLNDRMLVNVGHGHHIDVSLVQPSLGLERYAIVATPRSPQDFEDQTGDGGDGSASPAPAATPPPNYGSCSGNGGATWWDNAHNVGGCSQSGDGPLQLSCGNWWRSGNGVGTLLTYNGDEYRNNPFIIDNGDGTCRIN